MGSLCLEQARGETVSAPAVTLNPDGSVDTVVTRRVTTSGHTTEDYRASHDVPIDPYQPSACG